MIEPGGGSYLDAEQRRHQESIKKVQELLRKLEEYIVAVKTLEKVLVAYPFKNQRIAILLLRYQEHKQKLNKAKDFFQMIASYMADNVSSREKNAGTRLPAEYVQMLPVEGDSFPYEIQQFTEREKPEVQKLEGTTQEFSTIVDRIQQKILEAQKQFSSITQGDFNVVIVTLNTTVEMLDNAKEIVKQMQSPAVVGEAQARRYAVGLEKFKQVVEGLMRDLTAPNLNQATGADKEHWKKSYYGEFQKMLGVLQELTEHREVLRLGDQAREMIGEIDIIENQLRSLQLRDPDIPKSLE